jgi:hypothetical protein
MSTETNTEPQVKSAIVARRVTIIKIGHDELLAPADITTDHLLAVTELLSRCRVVRDNYDHTAGRYSYSIGENADVSLSIGSRLIAEKEGE